MGSSKHFGVFLSLTTCQLQMQREDISARNSTLPRASYLSSAACQTCLVMSERSATGLERPCMDRSVVAAAGTGSLSGVILNLVAQALASPLPSAPLLECPVCIEFQPGDLDFRSLGLGLLLGIAIGPLIDLLYGIRVLWRRAVARFWGSVARQYPYPLYRVHE